MTYHSQKSWRSEYTKCTVSLATSVVEDMLIIHNHSSLSPRISRSSPHQDFKDYSHQILSMVVLSWLLQRMQVTRHVPTPSQLSTMPFRHVSLKKQNGSFGMLNVSWGSTWPNKKQCIASLRQLFCLWHTSITPWWSEWCLLVPEIHKEGRWSWFSCQVGTKGCFDIDLIFKGLIPVQGKQDPLSVKS